MNDIKKACLEHVRLSVRDLLRTYRELGRSNLSSGHPTERRNTAACIPTTCCRNIILEIIQAR